MLVFHTLNIENLNLSFLHSASKILRTFSTFSYGMLGWEIFMQSECDPILRKDNIIAWKSRMNRASVHGSFI